MLQPGHRFAVQCPLSFVPPLQSDELLSSWAVRIEAYYEAPGFVAGTIGAAAEGLDISPSAHVLQKLANVTGYALPLLRQHTLAVDHPGWPVSGFGGLTYAKPDACLLCLSEMSATSIGVYTRRSWAVADPSVLLDQPLKGQGGTLCRCLQNKMPFRWRANGGCELTCRQCQILLRTSHGPDRPKMWRGLSRFEATLVASMEGQTRSMLRDLVDLWGRCGPDGGQHIRRISPVGIDPKYKPGVATRSDQLGSLSPASRRAFTGTLMSMVPQLAGRGPLDGVLPGTENRAFDSTTLFNGLSHEEIAPFRQKVEAWPREYRTMALNALSKLESQGRKLEEDVPSQKGHNEQKGSETVAEIRSRRSVAAGYLKRALTLLDSAAGRQAIQLRGAAQQKAIRRLARAELETHAGN